VEDEKFKRTGEQRILMLKIGLIEDAATVEYFTLFESGQKRRAFGVATLTMTMALN